MTARSFTARFFFTVTLALLSLPLWNAFGEASLFEETIDHDVFDRLAIYRPSEAPKGLLLLVSGSAGWDLKMAEIARSAAKLDYLVAGIDVRGYLSHVEKIPRPCVDLASDFRQLVDFLCQLFPFPIQKSPILVGYDTGGALVYVVLEQAESPFFHAAISLDFCPRLPLRKPLCRGQIPADSKTEDQEGVLLQPAEHLHTAWFVFQAEPACEAEAAIQFIHQVDGSRLVTLPCVDHQDPAHKGWMPRLLALLQWLDPRISEQILVDTDVKGVPLTEVHVPAAVPEAGQMAVMISGDGGWAALDRGLSAELARRGIPSVGWDSLSYFWKPRTPEKAGADLERVLQHYTKAWNKEDVLLIGYSFGADVLAFLANRLSPEMRSRVKLVFFLGLGPRASFAFHLTEWIGRAPGDGPSVLPEVERLTWASRLCIYGDLEKDSACPSLASAGVKVLKVPGDHHYDKDYAGIVNRVMEKMGR